LESLLRGIGTGGDQFGLGSFSNFHQTETTSSIRGKTVFMAEGGNRKSDELGGFKEGCSFFNRNG
jgi:hypothetical protein